MRTDELAHYGVLGMKWGRRKAKLSKVASKVTTVPKKKASEMTDDELKKEISRLELEKKYADLSKSDVKSTASKGKEFVNDILSASGKNIGTQATTYLMGTIVNKAVGSEIVNPKKGQSGK